MKPIDLRNATWLSLQADLQDLLREVYQAWLEHGPGTTRAVASRSRRDILSLRPRTTDLYHLGLIELTGSEGREGIYRARSQSDWENWIACQHLAPEAQMALI